MKNAFSFKRVILLSIFILTGSLFLNAQNGLKKVYNEDLNQMEQIDNAIAEAQKSGKFVVCQVGGNWCPWCLKFANFVSSDADISKIIDENFVFIHVNYRPGKKLEGQKAIVTGQMLRRLGNPGRFGYPVFVVLDNSGKPIHIQDSSFLESGDSYSKEKVLRFFKNWTPKAVGNEAKI